MRRRSLFPLVFLLWLLLYGVLLGVRPMTAPDEYRYAEIPREMMVSGDWVVPQLDGMPYFEKPVLGYWATALSMAAFGQNAWAVRLPSALGAMLMALAVAWLFRRHRDRRAAALSAAMLLSSLLVVAIGTTAILDALFSGLLSISLVGFFLAQEAGWGRKAGGYLMVAGLGIGLAFLVKGFLAIVVPGLIMLPYLLLTRSLGKFLRQSWIPLLWALVIAAPWSILVGLRSDFWQHFFWVEHVQRFLEPGENQHVEAFWFYVPRLILGLVPWIALLPSAGIGLRRIDSPSHIRMRAFALCWALAPLLFFSFSSGKLVSYVLPCIPAFVILICLGLLKYLEMGGRRLLALPAVLNFALGAGVVLFLVWGKDASQPMAQLIFSQNSRWIPVVAGAAVCAFLGVVAMGRRSSGVRLTLLVAAPLAFYAGLQIGLDSEILRSPGALLRSAGREPAPEVKLVGSGNTVQALCWEMRRMDVELFSKPTELAYGLEHTTNRRLLQLEDLKALASNSTAGVWILLDNKSWDRISGDFPSQKQLGRDRHYSLIKLGPGAPISSAAESQ